MRIVGSWTVFPFSAAVAEKFALVTGSKTPVVESTGSGGGLKLFRAGAGAGEGVNVLMAHFQIDF